VPNLKFLAPAIPKIWRGLKISKVGHVTPSQPVNRGCRWPHIWIRVTWYTSSEKSQYCLPYFSLVCAIYTKNDKRFLTMAVFYLADMYLTQLCCRYEIWI